MTTTSDSAREREESRREQWMQDRMADLMAEGAHGSDAYWQASGEWDDLHAEEPQL